MIVRPNFWEGREKFILALTKKKPHGRPCSVDFVGFEKIEHAWDSFPRPKDISGISARFIHMIADTPKEFKVQRNDELAAQSWILIYDLQKTFRT